MIDLFRRKRGHLPVHPQAHLRQKRGEEEKEGKRNEGERKSREK